VDTTVGRVKEVDQDDYEGGEDIVGIHGGRCEEGVGIGESEFIYAEHRGEFRMALGDVIGEPVLELRLNLVPSSSH